MAFKMKGSPMKRNFGIGASPMKKETKISLEKKEVKRVPTSKEYYKSREDQKAFDKGEMFTFTGRPKVLPASEDKKAKSEEDKYSIKKSMDKLKKTSPKKFKGEPKFTPGNVVRELRDQFKRTFGKGWRDKYKKKK